jgi:hypothetical protein
VDWRTGTSEAANAAAGVAGMEGDDRAGAGDMDRTAGWGAPLQTKRVTTGRVLADVREVVGESVVIGRFSG